MMLGYVPQPVELMLPLIVGESWHISLISFYAHSHAIRRHAGDRPPLRLLLTAWLAAYNVD